MKKIVKFYSSSAAAIAIKPQTTFYRRDLPSNLISFTSANGKQIFRESLLSGYAENYFPLVGNFTTQSEPAFCGLGSLAMVLNALEMDPGKQWKGVWRWYSDDNLECCADNVNTIKENGITFREFGCLAKCNGLSVISKRADEVSKDEFLSDLEKVCSNSLLHMVVSFNRKTLGQTGDGHFSPIGSYHAEKRMALVLDTARFKYPSYYVPADLLYESMQPIDSETGLSRGYFILSRSTEDKIKYHKPLSLCKLTKTIGISNPKLANLFCREIPSRITNTKPESLQQVFSLIFRAIPAQYTAFIGINDAHQMVVDLAAPDNSSTNEIIQDHNRELVLMLQEVQSLPLFNVVKESMEPSTTMMPSRSTATSFPLFGAISSSADINASLATIFILACPQELFKTLPRSLSQTLSQLRSSSSHGQVLKSEVGRLSDQLNTLMNDYCQCQRKIKAYSQLPSNRLIAK